jgi:hypothetical protein
MLEYKFITFLKVGMEIKYLVTFDTILAWIWREAYWLDSGV